MPATLPSLRQRLREATRPEHAALDDSLAALDLGDAGGYATFLRIQLTALDALAAQWASADAADFDALRERLADDLRGQPHAAVRLAPAPTAPSQRAAQWGMAYVIRGSRLGSQLLRARVAPGFARRYFDYVPGITWPEFLSHLELAAAGFDADAQRQAVAGAKFAFAAYAGAARDSLAPPP